MSLAEESLSGPSVIRAPHGIDFIDGSNGSSGTRKLRVNGIGSPETREISFDERTQTLGASQSASINPLYSQQTKSTTRTSKLMSSNPRVVHDLKEEIETMREMQKQQEEQHDELLGVLSQERAKNDARNARTLDLLKKKDAFIEELSGQYDEALERMQDLESALEEERMRGNSFQTRLGTLSRENDSYRKRLSEMEQVLENVKIELEAEKRARAEVEANMDDVAQGMDAAEEVMAEMESSFEKERRYLEKRCKNLETFIGEKLGIDASKHVRNLPSIAILDELSDQEGFAKDSKLFKANKALEDALIKNAIDTKRIGVEVGCQVHDIAVPLFIRDEDEIEEETLETLRAELEQVSKAHALAQQVALHAESELMAALDREADLQSQIKKQEMSKMDGEEEEKWREDALNKLVDLEDTCHQLESTISLKDEEIKHLQAEARDAIDGMARAEEASQKKQDEMNTQCIQMHDEIQSLRSELHQSKRKLASSEARIASLQAVQKFSLDLSGLPSLSIDQIDPSSEPIEFLVLSLQEATQIQTELLESLGELSYINDHREEELESVEADMRRLKSFISSGDVPLEPSRTIDSLNAARREEIDTLRSQLRRSVAIQQGQCQAYSELAEKSRNKESELKASLLQARELVNQHGQFMDNLETAVAAMKSGLAKIVLVEDGETAAEKILSMYSTPQSILELSIVLTDKLTDISQSMSEGSLNIGPYAENKIKNFEEKYKSIVSAYEAAKMEARHATKALEQLKGTLHRDTAQSMLQENISGATSGPILGDSSHLLNFVSKFEEVLDESARQEHKIQELEMKQSQWASSAWSTLVAKKIIQEKSRELWSKFKGDVQSLEKANQGYKEEIQSLKQQLDTAQTSLESSIRKQDMMKDRYQEEMERTKEIFEERIALMKNKLETQDHTHTSEMQNIVDTAAIEAEDRCAMEYQTSIDSMEVEISRLRHQCKQLEDEKRAIFDDFKRFQEVKNASIELLEQRLNALGMKTQVERKETVKRKDALSRIEEACNSDAVYAALHQAKIEKLQREKIEEEMNKLIHNQNGTIPASNQFKAALAQAEARIDSLDKRLETDPSASGDIERIKAEWNSEARKVEDEIIRLTLNQPVA
jgi:hypothetical protein